MPTYDYVCRACDHEFEAFQSMSAPVKKKCPECGELKLQRLIGAGAGIIFKGSGFYETDYRSDSYNKAARSERDSANGDKAESTTESKTGTTGESSTSSSSSTSSDSSSKSSSGGTNGSSSAGNAKSTSGTGSAAGK
jgi:putative FmdB family regulatory protein